MQEVAFQSLRKSKKLYKHKCHSSISINYCKTLLISKQTVNLDMNLSFSDLSEFCKIFPQSAGNGISETLDFNIFRGACPRTPLDASCLRHSILTPIRHSVTTVTNIHRSTPESDISTSRGT